MSSLSFSPPPPPILLTSSPPPQKCNSLHYHHQPRLSLLQLSKPSPTHCFFSQTPHFTPLSPPRLHLLRPCIDNKKFVTACIGTVGGFAEEKIGSLIDNVDGNEGLVSSLKESKVETDLTKQSIWKQMREIMMFSGPATGLWICGPLMSVISTAVIGQGSSTELAALGPGTVFCDNMNLLFMFLSIATSNMVATALAKRDKDEVQHQISALLFIALTCGIMMLLFNQFLGSWALAGFAGPKNAHIVPVATKYVQIRGLAWPAYLYGMVAQSASLGMKDSMGPLKALVVATTINGIGHLVLCKLLGYGITGAAWSTMASQVIAAYMMIEALNKKGYKGFSISVPSVKEFLQIFGIAAPVFVTMFSKVAFYSLMTYFATSMGTFTVAAHQVMIQMYGMCAVFGEPLSQTAQSFMPELLYGVERSLKKARMLLKSLMIIGAIIGLTIASIGAFIPLFFSGTFTPDVNVVQEMHKVLILFFVGVSAAPCTLSLEGTLLAGRDFKFISLSMASCFSLGALILMLARGYGLLGCWCALVAFQWARFFFAIRRLLSPNGVLSSEETIGFELGKLKAA